MSRLRSRLIPHGDLPERSTGDQVSHEAIYVLDTGKTDAHLTVGWVRAGIVGDQAAAQ
ncbi:MAG TPA: hypothetical protein VGR16_01090 [Thermomicrobiales bacterium]|nr:hypothetical protein [Thermomicrobiales bacterium]